MTMSTVAEPLTASILYRRQRAQIDLLQEAARQVSEHRKMDEETQSLLEQSVRIGLHAPAMMRDLWEWSLQREQAGRLRDRWLAGKDIRDQLCHWLERLELIHQSTRTSEAAGYPVAGADELLGAADELAVLAREVNQTWPLEEMPPPAASTGLSYEELRSLADHPPAGPDWPEEDFDRS
jgi:hypothetical protein